MGHWFESNPDHLNKPCYAAFLICNDQDVHFKVSAIKYNLSQVLIMKIETAYLSRCIHTLNKALEMLKQSNPESIEYEMYRSACIKEFEIILEQSGKLLRKVLKPYFHSSKAADKLNFKDLFRNAVLRNIISAEECERWLQYSDNRNSTAHDYGEDFAEETLILLPQFAADAAELATIIENLNAD